MRPGHQRLLVALFCALFAACGDDDTPKCSLDEDDPARQKLETRCDGIDNDCDGLTDVLARHPSNRCNVTGKKGACATGYNACFGANTQCLAPPAIDEAINGVDDDCDGVVDNIKAITTRPLKARVMVPPPMWSDTEDPKATILRGLELALKQAGIAYKSVDGLNETAGVIDWAQAFDELDDYAMVIMPGWVDPTDIVEKIHLPHRSTLQKWIESGGVLVWFKPLGPHPKSEGLGLAAQQNVAALGGFSKHKVHLTATRVIVYPNAPGMHELDSPEERSIRLSGGSTKVTVETLTYDVASKDADVVAVAMQDGKALGPVILRNKIGKGAVYTMGFDPAAYTAFRCYVNCFDPGRDILTVLLRGIFREAGGGHTVVKHTVPGTEDAVFIASHDVDAPDAFGPGQWGDAGMIQMAEMENKLGVKGSYFVTTDYVADYYLPKMVQKMCTIGQCPIGGHSIQHKDWKDFRYGTCEETRATYETAQAKDMTTIESVCGEVRVNFELLREAVPKGSRLDSWRTPYLESNPHQYEVLAKNGVAYDSSLGNGDVRTSFPFEIDTFPWLQDELFKRQKILEIPVTLEDGMGWFEGKDEKRVELTESTWPFFRGMWRRTIHENAANGATTTLLVHPSYGVGYGSTVTNLACKVDAVKWAIQEALQTNHRVVRFPEHGDFWRGRDTAEVEARYTANVGYTGKLTIGKNPAPSFSLAFTDDVAKFNCPGGGKVTIKGGRVVFEQTLKPGFSCSFTATPTKNGAPTGEPG